MVQRIYKIFSKLTMLSRSIIPLFWAYMAFTIEHFVCVCEHVVQKSIHNNPVEYCLPFTIENFDALFQGGLNDSICVQEDASPCSRHVLHAIAMVRHLNMGSPLDFLVAIIEV